MSEPRLINGTWVQTISYQLDELKHQVDAYLSGCTITPTGDTCTNILITEVLTRQSKPIIEVYNPHPIERKCNVTYNKQTKVVCLQPQVIKTPLPHLYMKVCGTYNPSNSTYVGCMRKVDRCYARALETNGSVNQGDITVVKCKDA